jgi:two-component system OmpR family response regulator
VRVLVVDDEVNVVTGIRRALIDEGYAVDTAADGRRGLELALRGEYDVIVLDVMLPGMNGYEVCRSARARPRRNWVETLTPSRPDGTANLSIC